MADAPLSFRQGTVVTWSQTTGANTVNVGGTVLENLPMLTTPEVTSLEAGSVVGLLKSGRQYFILGRIDLPAAGGGDLNIPAGSAGRGSLGSTHSTSALPSGGTTSSVHASTTLQKSVTSDADRLLRISLYTSVISTVAADLVAVAVRDVTSGGLPTGYAGVLTAPSGAAYDPGNGYVYIHERSAVVQAGPRAQPCSIVAYDDRGLSGSRTYQATVARVAGTGTCRIDADAVGPSLLMVEDVGPLI